MFIEEACLGDHQATLSLLLGDGRWVGMDVLVDARDMMETHRFMLIGAVQCRKSLSNAVCLIEIPRPASW